MNKAKRQSMMFGLHGTDLKTVSQLVERGLELRFELHDSHYLGEYYLFHGENEEEIRLRKNLDPLDGGPAELEFKDPPILLEVLGYPEDSPKVLDMNRLIHASIPGVKLLRLETY